MAPSDSKATFMRIPWAARMINQPNTICLIPGSREQKASTEDSLFAEILKTPRALRSVLSFYTRPEQTEPVVQEVSTLITLGDGINGHPNVMHGGIVAAVLDEAMGILQSVNHHRSHMRDVARGVADGEIPPAGYGYYTADLRIRYVKPVVTPGALLATARFTRREGRKEWIYAEIKQYTGATEDDDGSEVLCATGEALFVKPKWSKL